MVSLYENIDDTMNPEWPPIIGSIIAVKPPKYNEIFVGKVNNYMWTDTATVLKLLNNQDYVEKSLEQELNNQQHGKGKGFFMVLKTYPWQYIDNDKVEDVLKSISNKEQQTKDYINEPQTQYDLMNTSALYRDPGNEGDKNCYKTDSYDDNSLLTKQGEYDMDNLFKDNELHITFATTSFQQPSQKNMQQLLNILNDPKIIQIDDQEIIVSKMTAIKNLITDPKDELAEGNKIIKWINDKLISNKTTIFKDLKMNVFNGYVHIWRNGLNPNDTITKQLVKDLQYFKWQYGRPIDYDTLKYVLFQNKIQKSIKKDSIEQVEAVKILSQEFMIALQPEPKFQAWCLKRLLYCWYSDPDLQNAIRKIKVLVNQWRGRDDKDFNKKYGVQPSIVVYPRYGKHKARQVLAKLAGYFLIYQNIGWSCSNPTYFIKVNNLMWYTNGIIDLKLYFRKVKEESNGTLENDSFDEKYTKMKNQRDILYNPNVDLNNKNIN
jgi:hypothetical protein